MTLKIHFFPTKISENVRFSVFFHLQCEKPICDFMKWIQTTKKAYSVTWLNTKGFLVGEKYDLGDEVYCMFRTIEAYICHKVPLLTDPVQPGCSKNRFVTNSLTHGL